MHAASRVALFSILASAALAIAKIAVGLAAQSVAVVSDGIESAGDVLTSGLVYAALRISAKPADADHPYGHGRLDILAGLAVGVLLVLAGAGICLRALTASGQTPALFGLWPILASLFVKSGFALAKMRVGRRTRSAALIADAWNDSVDILSGFVALVAVMLAAFSPSRWVAADRYGGFLIGIIVLFLAVRTIRETTLYLMDTMPPPARMAEIRGIVMEVPGALGIEKCFARKTGLRYHVDLHLEVDPNLTVMASHGIAQRVRQHLRNRLEWVEDVLIHVEPHFTEASVEHGEPRNRKAAL
jgi:cation diffusion facilitator family transporter